MSAVEIAEAAYLEAAGESARESFSQSIGGVDVPLDHLATTSNEFVCPEVPPGEGYETYACYRAVSGEPVIYADPIPVSSDDSPNGEADPIEGPPDLAGDQDASTADARAEPVPRQCTMPDGRLRPILRQRFESCLSGVSEVRLYQLNPITLTGTFTFSWTLSTAAVWNSTTIAAEFSMRIDEVWQDGVGAYVYIYPNSPNMSVLNGPQSMTVNTAGQTFTTGTLRFEASNLSGGSLVLPDLSTGISLFAVNSKPNSLPSPSALYMNDGARCDRALFVTATSAGCVIDPEYAIAKFDAGQNPDFTRHVLRSVDSGVTPTLTRTDRDARNQNRAVACPGLPVPAAGLSCDEYPFASTREGANSAPDRGRTFGGCMRPQLPSWNTGSQPQPVGWSSCFISASQNSSSGAILGNFYTSNRVLVGDTFQIAFQDIVNAVDPVIQEIRNWNPSANPPIPDVLGTHPNAATTPDTIDLYWWRGSEGAPFVNREPSWESRQLVATNWSALNVNTLVSNVNLGGRVNSIGIIRQQGVELYYHAATGSGGIGPGIRIGTSAWNKMTELVGAYDWAGTGLPGLFAKDASSGPLYYYAFNASGSLQSRVSVGTGWNSVTEVTFAGRWNDDPFPDLIGAKPTVLSGSIPAPRVSGRAPECNSPRADLRI